MATLRNGSVSGVSQQHNNERKMAGNTLIEDPGIPLVGRRKGKFAKYVDEDSMSQSSNGPLSPAVTRFDSISYKLSRRKKLLNRRRMIVNLEFTLAMVGIILMFVETELFLNKVYSKRSIASLVIKSGISISTLFLLFAVIAYHVTGIQINQTDNGLDDWRLAVTPLTYVRIFVELAVCAIHPFPGRIVLGYFDTKGHATEVSIDAVLSILMLMRLYLVAKLLVVHSRLLTDTSTQSLGALNKVKINTVFVFKALMSEKPGTMLVAIMCIIFVINSWALRTCEGYYHPDHEHTNFRNAMWVIAITFLTVGYGDITPNSDCGRFIAVTTGLMGVGTTALLVAVLAQKLEQTRAEKYVHNFVTRIQLDKRRKNAAADVIKNLLMLWRLKRKGNVTDYQHRRAYGKLLKAIHSMRNAKNERSMVGENAVGVIEISKGVNDVFEIVETMDTEQKDVKTRVEAMEEKLGRIDSKLDAIHQALVRK
ncbi:small conductance calcium-activated potassium channel protein 2-like isoform X1 [Haliotis asinina]|uniref:small conductance calcium-activated potassium channel protein 2-like isoform X1 n=2 Tax=Haliotis asinina TaxID=109174 RepID=UPI003532089E